jgi:DNA repair protein RecO (recombination protein O)
MPQSQSSSAIILRTRQYGDIDVIATFLTRDFGKLTGIAKGAKHSRRRFVNSLEPFARVKIFFRLKAGATLAFLERCELQHSGYGMAMPTRFAYGSYLLELVDLLTHEADPIASIYDLLEEALMEIESGPVTSSLLRCFEMHLLTVLGYGPPLRQCISCGEVFAAGEDAFYDAHNAQVLCHRCGSLGPQSQKFTSDTVLALADLQETGLPASRALLLPTPVSREAAMFTGHLLAAHLPRPPKSLELIASLAR